MSAGRSVLSPRKPSSDEGEASAARVAASGIGGPGGSEAEPVSPFQLRPVFVAHTPSSSASSQSPSTHFSSVCVNDNHVILGTVAGNLLYYTKEEQLGTGGKKSTFSLKAVKQSAAGLKAQPANIIQPFISRTLAPPFAKPAAIAGAAGAASSGASAKLGADPVPPGQTKAVSWMAMISAKTFASLCESTLSFHTLPHLTPPKLMPYGQPVSTSLKAKLKSTAVDPTVDPRHLASCLRGVTCATSVTTDFYSGYSFVAAINQPASGVSSQLRQAVAQSGTSSWIAIGHPYGLVVLQLISDPAASGSDIAEDTVQFRIVAETALPFVPLSLAVSPPHIAKQSSYPQLVVCVSHASGFSTVSYKLGVGPGNAPLSTGIVQELFPSSVAPGFVPVVRHIPATETEMLVIPTPENAGIPVATDPGEFSLLAFSGNKLLAHTLHATSSISPSRTTVFFSLASASSGLSPLAVDSLILHGAPFSSVSTIWRDRIETVASISPQDLSSGTGETSWATQSLDPNMEEELQALNLRTSLAPQAPGPANAPGGSALSAGALVTIHYPGTAYRLALTSSGSVSRPLDDPFLLTQWGLFSIAPVTSPLQIANGLLRQAARHIATVIRGPAAGALPSVAEVLATTSDAVSLAHRFVIRELAVRASGAPGSGFQHDGRFLGSSASITTSMIGMNARDEALAMVRFIRLKAGYICLGAMALCQGRDSGGSQLEGPSAEGDAADTFGPFASASRASAEEVGVDARLVSDLQLCLSYCFSWFTKGCLDPRDLVRIFALGGLLPSSAVSREDPAGAPTDLTSSSTLQSGNGFSDMAELLESLRRTHGPVARDYAHKQSHILLARVLIYFRRGHPAITPPIFPAFRAEVDTALLACLSRLDASHAAFLLLTGGAPDEGPPPASIGRGIADPSAPLLMQLAPLVPAGMHAVDLIPRPAAVWWQAHCSAGSDLPLMTPGHARSPCDEALVQMFRSSQCFTSPVGRAFTPLYSGSIDRPMFDTLAAAGHARWFLLAQKARGQLADAIHLSLHLLLRRATVDATRATVALRSELGDLGQTPDLEAWLAAAPSALSDPGPGADGTAAPLPGAELSLKELSAWVPFLALAAPQPAMPAALRASLASGQPPGPGSGRPGSEPLSANGSPSGDLIDGLARLGMSPTGGRANPHLAHIHANWQAASARARQAAWQGFTRATLAAFVLGLTATEGGLEGGTASAVKPANLGTFVAHVESALAAMVASMHVALLGDHGLPAGASTVASPGASGPGGTGPAVPGLASRHWRAAVVGATLAAGRGLVSLVHQHLQRLGPGSSPAAGPAAGAGRLVTPADLGDWLDETYLCA
ncbi:hypothetical protein H696_00816 [Fonticula alba]|uniref:Uncharacterized protein n=1 Tax=Fonticula alba TaxID=691883 RepID=A0A058ZFY8_FONAL|nr:hypothetical protein H696_00816 [Fonticula alba]KCV73274.1 hypothetical protein H696_00816 [Fonticula alba]|eukprot:XP_009492975.1 hypothetical protein H696_00816 [Fonticula alba]